MDAEGKTPALGDAQARALLDAPPADTLKGKRDRAILSVLLFHGLRREELTRLLVKDFNQERSGVAHLRVQGKGGKLRYVPAHPHSLRLIDEYLQAAGHGQDADQAGIRKSENLGPHALRATAATSALENGADISKVQEWLGHANISTTRVYDRRGSRAEDSPTFKVRY